MFYYVYFLQCRLTRSALSTSKWSLGCQPVINLYDHGLVPPGKFIFFVSQHDAKTSVMSVIDLSIIRHIRVPHLSASESKVSCDTAQVWGIHEVYLCQPDINPQTGTATGIASANLFETHPQQ
jgi:hypothetical protein